MEFLGRGLLFFILFVLFAKIKHVWLLDGNTGRNDREGNAFAEFEINTSGGDNDE